MLKYLIILILFSFSFSDLNNKFKLCDINNNKLIEKNELKLCLQFPSNLNKDNSIDTIYNLFDVDTDLLLDYNEFELFFKLSLNNEREIEIITKDGIKKNIKQGEFLKLEDEQK